MPYQLSPKAKDDILDLYALGAFDFGPAQADRYLDGLEQTFSLLADFPGLARERTEIEEPVRIHPYRSHIIVYEVMGDDIVILRVRHGREDWGSLPR